MQEAICSIEYFMILITIFHIKISYKQRWM